MYFQNRFPRMISDSNEYRLEPNDTENLSNALKSTGLADLTKSSSSSSSASSPASSIAIKVAATAPIACKQAAASPPGNNVEHGAFKATATSN